jgi:ABC-type multidrug transport system fused ATPase/permease subunit
MATFFEHVGDAEITHPPILLLDASGSVKNTLFNEGVLIFDKMEQVLQSINATQFRLIFWNSDKEHPENNVNFPKGVLMFPGVIKKTGLKQPFLLAKGKITNASLTMPHLGFKSIPKEWIHTTLPTHIYFVTDGQMGWSDINHYDLTGLKSQLKMAIETLFKTHNNIHLHIISVESKLYDFNKTETLGAMAGGDVYEVIRINNLTKYITEFTSYTPNNPTGYRHINTVIAPAGFVPFMDNFFSEVKTGEFIVWLKDLVKTTNDSPSTTKEDDLLKIIQSLSATLRVLTKDKPQSVVNNIIAMFCSLFKNTVIDPTMVQFILVDTVRAETEGSAILYSQYRDKLKNLYKEAQNLLMQNTKNALGLVTEFITFPINHIIVVGSGNAVKESLRLGTSVYPMSSVKINNLIVPVFPLKTNIGALNEQCLRQFIRSVISKQFKIPDAMGDVIIYVVLGLVLKVVCSPDVSEKYKDVYKYIGHTMLRKKRLNSDITELSRFEEGNLPTSNKDGTMTEFYTHMHKVNTILEFECSPMTLWYAMCLALGNENLIVKQLIHCAEDINKDFGTIDAKSLLTILGPKMSQVIIKEYPEESQFDYSCIITLDDCTFIGGHKILDHITPTGSHCNPYYVISNDGKTFMKENNAMMCPICYAKLTDDSFMPVGPKVDVLCDIFDDSVIDPYKTITGFMGGAGGTPAAYVPAAYVPVVYAPQIIKTSTKKGHLIVLCGTVGSGKTTYATKIKEEVEKLGGVCIHEGPDKYCRQGKSNVEACNLVAQAFNKIDTIDNKLIVVIVDTCGEKLSGSNILFNYNFDGWRKQTIRPNFDQRQLIKYMAWSLRNVLQRKMHSSSTPYWLNPVSASVLVCINVHLKKCRALFGKKAPQITTKYLLDDILSEIEINANEYNDWLKANKDLDTEVYKIVKVMT